MEPGSWGQRVRQGSWCQQAQWGSWCQRVRQGLWGQWAQHVSWGQQMQPGSWDQRIPQGASVPRPVRPTVLVGFAGFLRPSRPRLGPGDSGQCRITQQRGWSVQHRPESSATGAGRDGADVRFVNRMRSAGAGRGRVRQGQRAQRAQRCQWCQRAQRCRRASGASGVGQGRGSSRCGRGNGCDRASEVSEAVGLAGC